MTTSEFDVRVNAVEFDGSCRCLCGTVCNRSTPLLARALERIDEPQYLFDAYRGCGFVGDLPFYVDVVERDASQRLLPSFAVMSPLPDPRCAWSQIPHFREVLQLLSPMVITRIGDPDESKRYSITWDVEEDFIYTTDARDDALRLMSCLREVLGNTSAGLRDSQSS